MPSGPVVAAPIAEEGAKKISFRPDIQGLRMLAVVAVVFDHLLHWPTGGFVGVDVFFVISGFLITGLLLREYDRTETISFRGFYARRVRRIIPAATLVLVVTSVAAYFLLSKSRFWETLSDSVWAFFFMGNWHMALVGTDYFQIGLPPSPVQHYWSLSVEEQFYFVWPWMMLALLLLAAKVGWSKTARRRTVAVVFVSVTAASLGWSMYETSTSPTFAYFSTFSRAWELGIGALLALAIPILTKIPNLLRPFLGWIGLLGILCSVYLITADMPFPGPWALPPVLSTALLIAAGTGAVGRSFQRAMFPLTNAVSRYIGDISFSIYLWHFPVIVLMLAVLPATSPMYLITCLVLTAALSVLSYHFVENFFRERRTAPAAPRRRRGRRGSHEPRRVVQLAGTGVLAVAVFTLALFALAPRATVEATPRQSATPVSSTAAVELCRGADFMDPTKGPTCDASALGDKLFPTVDGLADDKGGAYDCYRAENDALKTCIYGSSAADAKPVALVGDSHAAMLLPALRPQLETLNWRLDVYVGNGCQWKSSLQNSCADAMNEIRNRLTATPYAAVITTGARWVGGNTNFASNAYAEAWQQAISVGSHVIVIADVPGVSEEAIACISRVGFNPVSNDCGTPLADAVQQADPLPLAAQASGATLVDLGEYFCREDFCPSVIGNTQVYRDTASHVTASYMTTLAPYLLAKVQAAMQG